MFICEHIYEICNYIFIFMNKIYSYIFIFVCKRMQQGTEYRRKLRLFSIDGSERV